MALNKMNGWQRIWLVLSIISAISGTVVIFFEMPTQARIDRRYVYEVIDHVKRYDDSLSGESRWEIRDAYKGISDRELLDRLHKKKANEGAPPGWKDSILLDIDNEYKKETEKLSKDQFELIGGCFLGWAIITMIAVYMLGWAVGWIYRGFKKPSTGER